MLTPSFPQMQVQKVQQLLMKQQGAQQQKAAQPQQGTAAGQQKVRLSTQATRVHLFRQKDKCLKAAYGDPQSPSQMGPQQVTVQAASPALQQQKVTYATTTQIQPGIKTQFFTTPIAQGQKPTGAQQLQVRAASQVPLSPAPQRGHVGLCRGMGGCLRVGAHRPVGSVPRWLNSPRSCSSSPPWPTSSRSCPLHSR